MRQAEALSDVAPPPVTARYDVVLLDGRPRRLTLNLRFGLEPEDEIEVDGEAWTVADVRPTPVGPSQLICIHGE